MDEERIKAMIGIVTWYKNGNFGGTLQATALYKVLKKMKHEVEFVDYQPRGKDIWYLLYKRLRNVVFSFMYPASAVSRNTIWKFVASELPQSRKIYNYDQLRDYASQSYDAVICGSDQIWNCGQGVEEFYFLTFVPFEKRISYAPSIGRDYIKDEYHEKFIECIDGIRFLSIREVQGSKIIETLSNRIAKVVLDPIFLLSPKEWTSFTMEKDDGTTIPKERYILCYFLGKNNEFFEFAKKLSAKTKLPIHYISSKKKKESKTNQMISCGVRGFIKLINNADYVLTDSFHGCAFSIILQKQFGVFLRYFKDDFLCQNSRVQNIMQMLNIEKAIISGETQVADFISSKIQYEETEVKLIRARVESLKYLSASLHDALK